MNKENKSIQGLGLDIVLSAGLSALFLGVMLILKFTSFGTNFVEGFRSFIF